MSTPRAFPILVALLLTCAACSGSTDSSTSRTSADSTTSASTQPASTATTAASAASTDWPQYHHDAARTGAVENGPAPASLQRQWASTTLDGDVYAEPLLAGNEAIVATENDSVYAFDVATGTQRWRTHLGEPMAGSALPCGNIDPSGITSTPLVDVGRGVVDVVAFVQPGRHELVSLDLATGAVRHRRTIDPSGADPIVEQQRAALATTGGRVLVAFGGLYGDCGNYHGYVVAAHDDRDDTPSVWQSPVRGEAIWAPAGPVVRSDGSVLVATGNATATSDLSDASGDAVLRLSATDLRTLDAFAPTNEVTLSRTDRDLGSTSPALLDGGLVFQVGKDGVGYLLRGDHLGGLGGQIASVGLCSDGAYGGTAYAASTVLVPCGDGLVAVRVTGNHVAVAWRSAAFNAGPPVVGNGTVWTIDIDAGVLHGLDATTGAEAFRGSIGAVAHFATPTIAGDRLLVVGDRRLLAYGS
jgi:outer membrane protein assembly factor BamB